MSVKIFKYIFLFLLAVIINISSISASAGETQNSQSVDFTFTLDEFIKIEAVENAILTANITDRTGNLYAPLVSRFKVISNCDKRKTLYLRASTITESGKEEAMFDLGGRVYVAFANLAKLPMSEALANCKMDSHPESSPGVVAYPINSIYGAAHKYLRGEGKYAVYIDNGTTNITVNVGQNVLKSSFGKNDPNGFYQATLSLTESEI